MKKTFKQIISVILAIMILATTSVIALAAEITKEQAEAIAIEHAGYTPDQVKLGITEIDYEKGVKIYEVDFYFDNGDGSYFEYDYDINAADGTVIKWEKEKEITKIPVVDTNANDIGVEKAKQNALDAFNLNAADVTLVKAYKEYDDGSAVYEIEYRQGFDKEYSCDVDAATGEVFDMDVDINETFFDKIELLFKIFEYFFKNFFNS